MVALNTFIVLQQSQKRVSFLFSTKDSDIALKVSPKVSKRYKVTGHIVKQLILSN